MTTKPEPINLNNDSMKENKPNKEKKKKKTKKKVPRCAHPDCKTKLRLTDMPCKCNLTFCGIHKPFYKHNCCYKIQPITKINGIGGGNFQKLEVI
tara:strand:+ start:8857 stop:9141 length:285 start_codon:yes stop_codon:yes gene_type:complete